MATKQSKSKTRKEVVEPPSKEEMVPEIPDTPDLYKDFKYTPAIWAPRLKWVPLKTTQVSVLKRKEIPYYESQSLHNATSTVSAKDAAMTPLKQPANNQALTSAVGTPPGHSLSSFAGRLAVAPDYQLLDFHAFRPPSLTKWTSPGEQPLVRPPQQALMRLKTRQGAPRQLYDDSMRKERNSLAYFQHVKEEQLRLENYLMEKLNKERGFLLLRRQQVLPRIDLKGKEYGVLSQQSYESPTPDTVPAVTFFNFANPDYLWKGIPLTLTKRQRGHGVITEWLGVPHVTDPIVKQLGAAPTTEEAVKRLEKEQGQTYRQHANSCDESVMPLFPALAVVGQNYKDAADRNPTSYSLVQGTAQRSGGAGSYKSRPGSKAGGSRVTDEKPAKPSTQSGAESECGVRLQFGDNQFSWCPKHLNSYNKIGGKTYVVEVGCAAELGHSAVSSTSMTNTGTVAISYSWVRCDKLDPFDLKRYSKMYFAFDCWGGVILPGETHRIPCMYKAKDRGYFSEDWRLETRPVLEAGANIILRMWGVTQCQVQSAHDAEDVERGLRALITKSVVKQQVDKLIGNLAIKEVPLKDTRFPLVHLGPDLFHLKNPRFKYHSAPVYRLGKMLEIFETHLSRRSHFVQGDDDDDSKTSYTDEFGSTISSMHAVTNTTSASGKDVDTLHSRLTSELPPSSQNTANTEPAEDGLTASLHGGEAGHTVSFTVAKRETKQEVGELFAPGAKLAESSSELLHKDDGKFLPHNLPAFWPERIASIEVMFNVMTDLDKHPGRLLMPETFSVSKITKTATDSRNSAPTSNHQSAKSSKISLETHKASGADLNSSPKASKETNVGRLKTSPAMGVSFVNIIDSNYQVDDLREQILKTERLDLQEAAFLVLCEEVSKISFSHQEPRDNWKETLGHTYLCHAMDSFSDYADELKKACCLGQSTEGMLAKRLEQAAFATTSRSEVDSHTSLTDPDLQRRLSQGDQSDNHPAVEESASETRPLAEDSASAHQDVSAVRTAPKTVVSDLKFLVSVTEFPRPEDCAQNNPRDVLTYTRYQGQYISRLYTRMYQLLSDFVDTMGKVWDSEQKLSLDLEEVGFTRIKHIGPCANIEDYLHAPLPPPWVGMAQRLDAVELANKTRIRSPEFRGSF